MLAEDTIAIFIFNLLILNRTNNFNVTYVKTLVESGTFLVNFRLKASSWWLVQRLLGCFVITTTTTKSTIRCPRTLHGEIRECGRTSDWQKVLEGNYVSLQMEFASGISGSILYLNTLTKKSFQKWFLFITYKNSSSLLVLVLCIIVP